MSKEGPMLRWALVFLIVALLAALFGFTDIAGAAAWIAKFLFFLFLVGFVLCAIFGVRRRRLLILNVRRTGKPRAR
jgi:uncharacterized membrane protein YtjA (UPF0391 family)